MGSEIKHLDSLPSDIWSQFLSYLDWSNLSNLSLTTRLVRNRLQASLKKLKYIGDNLPPFVSGLTTLESYITQSEISPRIAVALPRSLKSLSCSRLSDGLDMSLLPSLSSLSFSMDHSSYLRHASFPPTLTSFASTNWGGWTGDMFDLLPKTLVVLKISSLTWKPVHDEDLVYLPRALIILELELGELFSDLAIPRLPRQLQALKLAPKLLLLTATGIASLPSELSQLSLPTANDRHVNAFFRLRGITKPNAERSVDPKAWTVPVPSALLLSELRLSSLEYPDLKSLSQLPNTLEVLDLAHAKQVRFSDHLAHLTNLHTLIILTLSSGDVAYLPRHLYTLKSGAGLEVDDPTIVGPHDVEHLPPHLTRLNIQSKFTIGCAYRLPKSLIWFKAHGIKFHGWSSLVKLLDSSPPLFESIDPSLPLSLSITYLQPFLELFANKKTFFKSIRNVPIPYNLAPWVCQRSLKMRISMKRLLETWIPEGIAVLEITGSSLSPLQPPPNFHLPTTLKKLQISIPSDRGAEVLAYLPEHLQRLDLNVPLRLLSLPSFLTHISVVFRGSHIRFLSLLKFFPPLLQSFVVRMLDAQAEFEQDFASNHISLIEEYARPYLLEYLNYKHQNQAQKGTAEYESWAHAWKTDALDYPRDFRLPESFWMFAIISTIRGGNLKQFHLTARHPERFLDYPNAIPTIIEHGIEFKLVRSSRRECRETNSAIPSFPSIHSILLAEYPQITIQEPSAYHKDDAAQKTQIDLPRSSPTVTNNTVIWTDSNSASIPPDLTTLDANTSDFTHVSFPHLPCTLTRLSLSNSRSVTDGAIGLLPRGITSLTLDTAQLSDACVPFLPPFLLNLTVRCNLSDHAMPLLPRTLQSLVMTSNTILTDAGIAGLPSSLERLNLLFNQLVTNLGLASLPRGLLSLNLYSNDNISDAGIENLPPLLTQLNLYSANLSDSAVGLLPRGLTELNISSSTKITDESLERMPLTLTHLRLSNNTTITASGLSRLSNNLRILDVSRVDMSNENDFFILPPWIRELTIARQPTWISIFSALPYLSLSAAAHWDSLRSGKV